MNHSYERTYSNGVMAFSVQDQCFTEDEMLKACKASKSKEFNTVVRVKYHRHIPNGYHLCGCGNLAKGSKDELCQACREIYGHTFEYQLQSLGKC